MFLSHKSSFSSPAKFGDHIYPFACYNGEGFGEFSCFMSGSDIYGGSYFRGHSIFVFKQQDELNNQPKCE